MSPLSALHEPQARDAGARDQHHYQEVDHDFS
jgi:hypothetical protein